ncbi:MAG: hypothetical protein WKF48_05665 [Solirubrobacteraceae bacterium]
MPEPHPLSDPLSGGAEGPLTRDRAREASFLEEAARGHSAFVLQASQRLEQGQAIYGDAWRQRGAATLVGELLEEAADIGAWGALAAQSLDAGGAHARARALLALAARRGAQAHAALTSAAAALVEGDP